MGRKRQADRHLPERVYQKHGAYYFQPRPAERGRFGGKSWIRLGATLAEMYRAMAELNKDETAPLRTMNQLFDRYAREVIPEKKPATQRSNLNSLPFLRAYFGEMLITAVESPHCFEYRNLRSQAGATTANRDLEVLSHAFSKAIEWGAIKNDAHPMRGLQIKIARPPRDRYVEDWELDFFKANASPFLRAYCDLKVMTGLSKGDLLSIRLDDMREDGIHYQRRKTTGRGAKRKVIAWTPELHEAINAIQALPRPVGSLWLFCTREGQPYIKEDGTTSGFDSIWQRAIRSALEAGAAAVAEGKRGLTIRFTEHDLRAKAASDTDEDHAQKLLDHTSKAITRRVYIRKPEVVTPIRKTLSNKTGTNDGNPEEN